MFDFFAHALPCSWTPPRSLRACASRLSRPTSPGSGLGPSPEVLAPLGALNRLELRSSGGVASSTYAAPSGSLSLLTPSSLTCPARLFHRAHALGIAPFEGFLPAPGGPTSRSNRPCLPFVAASGRCGWSTSDRLPCNLGFQAFSPDRSQTHRSRVAVALRQACSSLGLLPLEACASWRRCEPPRTSSHGSSTSL